MLGENSIWKKSAIWLTYLLIFLIMYFFCSHTPLVADDFCQMGVAPFDAKKTFLAQWAFYTRMNGRFPAHLFDSFVLLRAEWIHTVLTPLIFTGIIFIICILVWGTRWKRNIRWYHPLFAFALLWIFTPAFGQAYLWRTGSANYCYTTFVSLIFWIPFRLLLDEPGWRPKKISLCLLLVVSFLAGWSNENLGIINVLGGGAFLAYLYKKQKKVFSWAMVLVAICLMGWAFLILSPGNYGRLHLPAFAYYRDASTFLKLKWFLVFLGKNELNYLPLSGIAIIGFIYCIYKKEFGVLFFTASAYYVLFQLSMGAFLFSPVPHQRALTASTVFLCLSSITFLSFFSNALLKKSILGIFILICFYSVTENTFLFLKQYEVVKQRKEALKKSTEPVFERWHEGSVKYFFPASGGDIDVDWVEWCFRRHHKVKKVYLK